PGRGAASAAKACVPFGGTASTSSPADRRGMAAPHRGHRPGRSVASGRTRTKLPHSHRTVPRPFAGGDFAAVTIGRGGSAEESGTVSPPPHTGQRTGRPAYSVGLTRRLPHAHEKLSAMTLPPDGRGQRRDRASPARRTWTGLVPARRPPGPAGTLVQTRRVGRRPLVFRGHRRLSRWRGDRRCPLRLARRPHRPRPGDDPERAHLRGL